MGIFNTRPPDYDDLPDTGGVAGETPLERRVRRVEKCVSHTDKQLGWGVKLGTGILLAVLGSLGTFVTTGIQTTERVERNGEELDQAAVDRREVHDDVDQLTVEVVELRGDVRNAGREAEQREKRTTMAIDNLTRAVNMRRR